MKKELIGIIIFMLLIFTVLPAYANNLEKTTVNISYITSYIQSGLLRTRQIFGCTGVIVYTGDFEDEKVTINYTFNVDSYSLKGEYLGNSSKSYDNLEMGYPNQVIRHIIPDNYGETHTWVHAKLDVVNVDNSEQMESIQRIGLSIGFFIFFSSIITLIFQILNILI